MITNSVAIMIYGDINSTRDALTEDKYKDLAGAFSSSGFNIKSVLYNNEFADKLAVNLFQFDAVLVWVNPVDLMHCWLSCRVKVVSFQHIPK
jgi:hypothetical protein